MTPLIADLQMLISHWSMILSGIFFYILIIVNPLAFQNGMTLENWFVYKKANNLLKCFLKLSVCKIQNKISHL